MSLLIREVPQEYQNTLKSKIMTSKFGEPQNIFNAIKFLMVTDYINGTSIDVNGGLY